MTSPQLEGAALFDAVCNILPLSAKCNVGHWLLVPDMLEWLRGRVGSVEIFCWHDGDTFVKSDRYPEIEVLSPDLPTALARLVVRVAEIEGGKP